MTGEQKVPTLGVHLRGCRPCEESKKTTEKRKVPILGVHFREVSALKRFIENDWR